MIFLFLDVMQQHVGKSLEFRVPRIGLNRGIKDG
jgi:hypothetical protein